MYTVLHSYKAGCYAWPTWIKEGGSMLYYALVFFIVAIVAAVLGFGGIAAGAASIAKILFFVFLVLAVLSLIRGMTRK